MNKHIFRYLKIAVVLTVAFIVTSIASTTLFYPASPRVNPQFLANVAKLFEKKNPYDQLKNISLTTMTKISQGVYAKEEPSLNTTFIRITSEAKFEIKEVTINGKLVRILVQHQPDYSSDYK